MNDDAELLRRYVKDRSQAAFAELVRRHLSLVYSVALRQVGGDSHLAEDVVQQVFTALARKGATLADRPTVGGWLYRSTHFAASDVVRMERRRRVREQEAHTMDLSNTSGSPSVTPTGNGIDWDKVRPTIDAAIAELEERDRDAVSLRFFEGRTFADVGAQLRLTENAARMRVERALDKLHAALTRRGVTSTSAVLGLALANQIGAAVPAGLATSITGAVLAGSAAGGLGFLASIGSGKLVAGVSAGVAAAAIGVAVVQHGEKTGARMALASAEQQRHAMQIEVENMRARAAQSESRTAEAEKDSGELLKAVQALRSEQTKRASRPGEEDERLTQERAYQQQLAKRRADESKARAKIDEAAAMELDAAARYNLLIETAEQLAANAEFQAAIRRYNQAMQAKPAGLAVSDRVRQLQTTLAAQNKPVDVTFTSDGMTWVAIVNFRQPEKLSTNVVRILPGDYTVVGRRKGFRDVEMLLRVRNGEPPPVVSVVCTVSSGP
jgi:RNA polymerase sigma factor (sigma-70 family)